MIRYSVHYSSPIGGITLESDGSALTALYFCEQERACATENGENIDALICARKWLDTYFSGKRPDNAPPLLPDGATPFRKAVWDLLVKVPYGKTSTYGNLARELEKSGGTRVAAQAVGGAVGHNPIAIIIPCHRIVGADGSLTGYAGGPDKKIALLAIEGVTLPRPDKLAKKSR